MRGAIASHLWQSTVFAGAAAVLALALHANRARVRYLIWLSASLKFLVPFAPLVSLGSYISVFASPSVREIAATTPALSYAIQYVSRSVLPAAILPVSAASEFKLWDLVIPGVWACVALFLVSLRLQLWRRIRRILCTSSATDLAFPVEVRSLPGVWEPAVVGFIRPVILLPQGITERLSGPELNAILAHELCHVRRHDNLLAFLHLIAETVFWFHPLVWLIGAQLVEERENACDEAVVRQGYAPEIYAEAIFNVCMLCSRSPLACVSGVTGANLKRRIEVIMTDGFGQRLSRGKKVLLIAAGAAALIAPLVVGSFETRLSAQSSAPQGSAVFEVASVKRARSGFATGQKGIGRDFTTDFGVNHLTFRARGLTLYGLIVEAYGLKFCRPIVAVGCPMITGGPPWLSRDAFNVDAKSPPGSEEYDTMQLRNGQAPQLQEELRNLLADRFQLKVHFETRQLPVYAFTVADRGLRIKKVTDSGASPKVVFKPMELPGGVHATQVIATQATIQQLADLYSKFMDRPVIDGTGLTDRFDFTVQYEAEADAVAGPFGAITSPTLFAAFETQTGLKVKATRGPVEILVIDGASHPSAN